MNADLPSLSPDVLPANQTYAVICLVHAGSDLENFKLQSWVDAASILVQVAQTCAEAESAIGFEVRLPHLAGQLQSACDDNRS